MARDILDHGAERVLEAYRKVFNRPDDPDVQLVLTDLMESGHVLRHFGRGVATTEGLWRVSGAHDLVVHILDKAGLTDAAPEMLMTMRRNKRRADLEKTHGEDRK